MRVRYIKASLFFTILCIILSISFAASGNFNEILVHNATIDVDVKWIAPNTSFKANFSITNNLSSPDNITYIQLANDNSTGSDPFNITNFTAPANWNCAVSDTDPKDNLTDTLDCKNYRLLPGETMNITLELFSKNIPAGTTLSSNWFWWLKDNKNNVSYAYGDLEMIIDAKGPDVNITVPADNSAFRKDIQFNITSEESEVQIDQSAFSFNATCLTNASNYTVPVFDCNTTNTSCNISFIWRSDINTTDGECNVTVAFYDTFGNAGTDTIKLIIDNTPPQLTYNSPATVYRGYSSTIIVDVNDTGVGLNHNALCGDIYLNGADYGNAYYDSSSKRCTGSISIPPTLSDPAVILMNVSDSVGNYANVSQTVSVQTKYSGGSGGNGGSPPPPQTQEEANRAPTLTAPVIDNTMPLSDDIIFCESGEYSDVDGDEQAGEEYRWYMNGLPQFAYDQELDLVIMGVEPGDSLRCAQRVYDGEAWSEWIFSSNTAVVQDETADELYIPGGPGGGQAPMEGTTGITGAFIGSFSDLGPLETIAMISAICALLTIFILRTLWNRKKSFKLQ